MKKYIQSTIAIIIMLLYLTVTTSSQTKQEPTITLTVTITEANYLLQGLNELPAKIANPLSQKIQNQATAQLNPPKKDTTTKISPKKP